MSKNCSDFNQEFESWLKDKEYHKIQDEIIGLSIYSSELGENYFCHEYNIITSIPKNFRISTLSTSRNDLNSIKTYLNLVKSINKNEIQNSIDKEKFIEKTKDALTKNESKEYYWKIEIVNKYLYAGFSVKSQKQDIGIEGSKNVISIVFISETNKSLLISVPVKERLSNYTKGAFVENILKIFFLGEKNINNENETKSFVTIRNEFLFTTTKRLMSSIDDLHTTMTTSIVLFTDISNSTPLINIYPREGLHFIRKLTTVLAKTIEKNYFLINEIPGDGILYSQNMSDFFTAQSNSNEKDFLNVFLNNLYREYNSAKNELLNNYMEFCEYQDNKSFYTNFEELVKRTYLKTAICIDGIYFTPLEGISFKQSILYGTKLWNIPRIFSKFEDEKNENDIVVYNKNVCEYYEIFLNKTFSICGKDKIDEWNLIYFNFKCEENKNGTQENE